MSHKTILGVALAGALTFTSAAYLSAQQPMQKGEKKSGDMPMGGMMKECHEHHQAMMKSLDDMSKTVEGAQQSNDAAKMKSALAQVQKQLTSMKEHTSKCDSMMNMMDKMQGMPGGMK